MEIKHITPPEIERIDREFMRNQEQNRIIERTAHIWPIFLSLSTVFGFIGLQSGDGAYLVGLFPILVSCLAQHVNDSEQTLRNIRKYLYWQEQTVEGCYSGGEQYFRDHHDEHAPKAGNKKALRRAFVTTSLLAAILFIRHLQQDSVPLPLILLASGIEFWSCWCSLYWLTYWKPIVQRCRHWRGIKEHKEN